MDPARVAEACDLTDVDVARVRPAPVWLERLWLGPVVAMTVPGSVFVRRDRLGDPGLAPLLVHELVHIRQWRDHGVLGFLVRYLAEYLRGRGRGLTHWQAYRQITLESEAREIAGC